MRALTTKGSATVIRAATLGQFPLQILTLQLPFAPVGAPGAGLLQRFRAVSSGRSAPID